MATNLRMVIAILALVIFASTAANARTTAGQVTDRESLKAFVESAKEYIEAITDINEWSTSSGIRSGRRAIGSPGRCFW